MGLLFLKPPSKTMQAHARKMVRDREEATTKAEKEEVFSRFLECYKSWEGGDNGDGLPTFIFNYSDKPVLAKNGANDSGNGTYHAVNKGTSIACEGVDGVAVDGKVFKCPNVTPVLITEEEKVRCILKERLTDDSPEANQSHWKKLFEGAREQRRQSSSPSSGRDSESKGGGDKGGSDSRNEPARHHDVEDPVEEWTINYRPDPSEMTA